MKEDEGVESHTTAHFDSDSLAFGKTKTIFWNGPSWNSALNVINDIVFLENRI